MRDRQLAPQIGARHFIPRDEQIEGKLIEVEKLIGRKIYKAAIREARRKKTYEHFVDILTRPHTKENSNDR